MTASLDVLLIESHPGVGAVDAEQLAAAGHRVHRCYPARDPHAGRVPLSERYLCTGVTDGTCPLDAGMDVALLVRQRIATRPAAREAGVSCALRAGVPVVEDGPDLLDPYQPWLAARVHDHDAAATCQEAASTAFDSLRDEIRRRTASVLTGAGVDPAEVTHRFEPDWPRVTIVLCGPPATRALKQALAVRTLDAVRAGRRTLGQVDITYEEQPT